MTRRFGALLAGLFALVSVLYVAGCGGGHPADDNNNNNTTTSGSGTGTTTTVPPPPVTTSGGTTTGGTTTGTTTTGTATTTTGGTTTGGTTGGTTPTQTRVTTTVQWAARTTRAQLSSALSVVLNFAGAQPGGADLVIVADRNRDNLNAYTQSYTSSAVANTGTYNVTATYFAGAGGTGEVVGFQSVPGVVIPADGNVTLNLDPTARIVRVELAQNQVIRVGETRSIAFAGFDSNGAYVPVSDGSVFLTLAGGNGLAINGVNITGTRPGTTNLVATIDGTSSAPTSVQVTSNATVTTPQPAILTSLSETITLTANVQNVPAGETGVVWSIQGDPRGAVVDQQGRFTAPATLPGNDQQAVYTVVATSQYDPSKSTTINITVDFIFDIREVKAGVAQPSGAPIYVSVNGSVDLRENPLVNSNVDPNQRVRNRPPYGVIWQVKEGATGGFVTAQGTYVAPAFRGEYHIIVTSTQYPNRSIEIPVFALGGNQTIIIN